MWLLRNRAAPFQRVHRSPLGAAKSCATCARHGLPRPQATAWVRTLSLIERGARSRLREPPGFQSAVRRRKTGAIASSDVSFLGRHGGSCRIRAGGRHLEYDRRHHQGHHWRGRDLGSLLAGRAGVVGPLSTSEQAGLPARGGVLQSVYASYLGSSAFNRPSNTGSSDGKIACGTGEILNPTVAGAVSSSFSRGHFASPRSARRSRHSSRRPPVSGSFRKLATIGDPADVDGVVQDSSPGSLRLVDGGLVLLAAMRTRHSFGVQTLGLDRTSRTESLCAG